ncbi:Ig-like domain-containing protein, partial [Rhodohalobacter sulfatireducens]
SEAASPEGLTFKPDLTTFYVTSNGDNIVHQYYTYEIDPDESSVIARENEIEANGTDYNRIEVTLRSENGVRLPNLEVNLIADGEDLEVQAINDITDEDGEAVFRVRTSTPQVVTYTAIAEKNSDDIELDDDPEVRFLPEAPVALSATDVEEREFKANWEMVPGVSNYLLDVATDSEFDNILNDYNSLDVGEVTDYRVTDLNPGTVYYYRLKSELNGFTGKNSETIEVTTFPDIPLSTAPGNISATKFIAQWQEAEGANGYLLDVATDANFSEFVQGFENFNVGQVTEYTIENLIPGTEYYYRVKSTAFSRISNPSETIQTTTFDVGSDETELTSSQLRVLANGEQENIITLVLRTPEGINIKGEDVTLEALNGDSQIEVLQGVTDDKGEVRYSVTNNTAEEVTYRAFISQNLGVGTLTVEFLPVTNELTIGDNYPNPFSRITTIPVTVPTRMRIKITVANILGSTVKTVIDEELETGYYEIAIDLGDVASGTYFYRLMTDDKMKTKKMLLVK